VPVSPDLTSDLKKVVLTLEDDLRRRVESQPHVLAQWHEQHREAVGRDRTAMSWQEWRDDRVTQAAVAWVLTTVFVRFCEDNALLAPVWLAGPPARQQEALDAELAYFREHPEHTAREWIGEAIAHLRTVEATRDLAESHSPLWLVSPSGQAAKALVDFWRAKTDDGHLVRDFTDPDLSTRFLGDLYQDLSDYAKKTFALLQTPGFVEEFILDQTLEPALAERPLEGFTLIDPTCGSGHFLLGAFARLVERWATAAPGLNSWDRVQKALDAIHGVDLNPFAVAIARFRLVVAALQACELTSLEAAPGFTVNLAAGDSLLHGSHQLAMQFDGFDADSQLSGFAYATEDLDALRRILSPGRYDVVVGNPPYITVKDKTLNAAYRELYPTCKGTYALTVPFMERFFDLAKRRDGDHPAGWTGQITSNSFMKREFGSRLIEEFLAKQDLRLVVDTSGAYIPGHGTPTVIIAGRPQAPVGPTVRAVLGVRGEPGQPKDPAQGLVWTEIVDNVASSEFDGTYVSVTDLPRAALASHPWSLAGGGADGLLTRINCAPHSLLGDRAAEIGFGAVTREDSAFMIGSHSARRLGVPSEHVLPIVEGDVTRDWALHGPTGSIWPYDPRTLAAEADSATERILWPHRSRLSDRVAYGLTQIQRGLEWFEYSMFFRKRFETPLSIAFAFVATHNHFVLDRGGKVFKQSAPVIKLPAEATEDDHLALLGILNSSTACFWLKQNSHNKGSTVDTKGARQTQVAWENFYEFTGTTLQDFPLTATLPLARGRLMDSLAQDLAAVSPGAVAEAGVPTAAALAQAHEEYTSLRGRMIAEQEELDWEVYRLYGLIDDGLTYQREVPEVALGERAFEIVLARKVAAGDEETAWFTRHGSTPVTQIPAHWPTDYRDLVQRRLDLIASDKSIRLLETPEHKRRWASESWEKQVDTALRSWLLDRLEQRHYWFDQNGRPTPTSIGRLADVVTRDADLVSVLELWSGRRDQSVATSLAALLTDEAVPFLAAHRLKDTGLRKREAWEHTWDLQRKEDAGILTDDERPIPVPPKYTSADFRKASWWQARGKLDVPKERFVLYPGAGRETDPTLVLGWAGWDHAQQFLALATLIAERETEGWEDERLVPLVAGLAELMPWVRQWHDEVDPTYGVNMADFCEEQLRDRAAQVGKTVDQLRAWRPAAPTRGRRPRATP